MVEIIEVDCKHWSEQMETVESVVPAELQALGLTSIAIFEKWLNAAKTTRGRQHFNREVQTAADQRNYYERQINNPALTPSVQENFKAGIQEQNRVIALNNWFLANGGK